MGCLGVYEREGTAFNHFLCYDVGIEFTRGVVSWVGTTPDDPNK